MAAYPGGRVFVAEQEGVVALYGAGGAPAGTLLDIRSQVSRAGNEEGFLSFALDPQFPARPYAYAYYSVSGGERRTRLSRFEVQGDAVLSGSELVILEQPQPFSNHKGGAIRFGPDGMLYLGFGDGGSQGDPSNRAQDLGQWLGKMLRIDVRNTREGAPYTVPGDNPFVGRSGAKPEIWAYGFRNPWRASFDVATGSLWVADVGQNAIEEIDVVTRGGNLGWSHFEGERCYKQPCDGSGMTAPVASYTHAEGCSVSGGVVYRGRALPALVGHYLYADFCSGRVWAVNVEGGEPVQLLGQSSERRVASFGTDADGEVYLLIHGGPVQKVVGVE
jgi:glucose/arabinose dehydrogenase